MVTLGFRNNAMDRYESASLVTISIPNPKIVKDLIESNSKFITMHKINKNYKFL